MFLKNTIFVIKIQLLRLLNTILQFQRLAGLHILLPLHCAIYCLLKTNPPFLCVLNICDVDFFPFLRGSKGKILFL